MVENYSVSNHPSPLLTGRRKFLFTSGLGVVGIVISPFVRAKASPVFLAVAKFAKAIGAAVVADGVDEFIKRHEIPKETALEVARIACQSFRPTNGEFSDYSKAAVYSPISERRYFFFSVKSIDGFNASAYFFDRQREKEFQLIGQIGGPTLFGISELSTHVAEKQSKVTVKQAFLPREIAKGAIHKLDMNFNKPEIYRTESGRVESVYRTDGNGIGEIRVQAISSGGTVIAKGTFDLTYRAN